MPPSKVAVLRSIPKAPDDPNDFAEGTALANGRFEIHQTLGKGGVATVYRATDSARGAQVALKVLSAERSQDPRELQRFRNEIEINERVPAHPNLIQPFETGSLDARPYLASELGRGPTAQDLFIFAPLSEARALAIATGIATALAHMHDAGVLHRDVKPSNVIVEPSDDEGTPERARLFDFGYSIATADIADLPASDRLTQAGELPGTKHYMAPEQVLGRQASKTSDIYALGVSLYEMLVGAPPWADLSPADAALRKASHGAQPPEITERRDDVAPGTAALIRDALATAPHGRIKDAHEFLRRLRELNESPPATVASTEPERTAATSTTTGAKGRTVAKTLIVFSFVLLGVALLGIFARRPEPQTLSTVGFAFDVRTSAKPQPTVPVPPEPEPTPEPTPEPGPAHPPAAEPKPTPEPAPKKHHSTPRSPAIDCEEERAAAKHAADWGSWSQLAKHTKHTKCWSTRLDWERLRAKALFKTGNAAGCLRLANRSKHPEIQRYKKICASMAPTETP